MERHMFFGGNTPEGFYGCFDNILFLKEAKKMIYLKGSSGSGKSTLMRKVAAAYEEKGMAVDYVHCSNNVSDLDGICIREMGIGMVDATAPHVCDPKVPVAIDEIFNLADFIGREYVQGHAAELLDLQERKKPYYIKAYRYLNAADKVYSNNSYIYDQALNKRAIRVLAEAETKRFYQEEMSQTPGMNRHMFASAISPQGRVSYLDSLIQDKFVIAFKGERGMGMNQVLHAIQEAANSRGYDTESCMCTLEKEKIDHLLIPELNLAYVTLNDYHQIQKATDRVIVFGDFCDRELLKDYAGELAYNKQIFEELLEKSMKMMDAQKVVHDQIETIYGACMDFAGLDRAFDTIMEIIAGSLH